MVCACLLLAACGGPSRHRVTTTASTPPASSTTASTPPASSSTAATSTSISPTTATSTTTSSLSSVSLTASSTSTSTTLTLPPAGQGMAIGITEANADLLWSDGAAPAGESAFAPWRTALAALHPTYLRLVLDWAAFAPQRGPAELSEAVDGCDRGIPPCGAYAGLRDELRAIASQQRAQGGFIPVIVLDGTPAWAARPPSGCERSGTTSISRPLAADALDDYRQFIRSILALGQSVGVTLPYWSPWNEPNHPFFISPQRAHCRTSSPSLAPHIYAQLARAMSGVLATDPQPHEMLMGELAGFTASDVHATSISEFVSDVPADVLCLGSIWTVHAYARRGSGARASGPVGQLEDALRMRGGCAANARIWITETGAGAPHAGRARPAGVVDERAGCRSLDEQLLRWYHDPRVDAVFQYTFREDTLFPVGLADAGLTRLYPSYYLWRAWGGSRVPSAAPPTVPPQCR